MVVLQPGEILGSDHKKRGRVVHAELIELLKLTGANAVAVWTWAPEVEALQIKASRGLTKAYIEYGNITAVTPKSKVYAPIYRSLYHGYPVQFVEPQTLHFPKYFEEWPEMSAFTQLATLPILMQNVVVGVLSLYFKTVRAEHPWQESLDLGLFVNRLATQLMDSHTPEARTPRYDAFMAAAEPVLCEIERVVERADCCKKL